MNSLLKGNYLKKIVPGEKTDLSCAETERLPLPKKIIVPMQQHIGAPCHPVVQKKQQVEVGSLLGVVLPGQMGAPIHSGVSGQVVSVEEIRSVTGKLVEAVVIETDGVQTPSKEVRPVILSDTASFLRAVEQSGIVGLGGAGFPAAAKLAHALKNNVKTLIINAAECEPFIESDSREMVECAENILEGMRLISSYLPIEAVYLGIEKNKPEALQKMRDIIQGFPNGKVVELLEAYPQGAEKMLVKAIAGKKIPRGKLPADVGALVMNVSTVSAIAKYIATGMPLVSRRLSVAGNALKTSKNIMTIIGTPIEEVLDFCGLLENPSKVIMGGPMMGIAVANVEYPVLKHNNGIFAFAGSAGIAPRPGICIRCGCCIDACSMGLSPVEISSAMDNEDFEAVKGMAADLCIACGACSYVCPAKRHVAQAVVQASVFCKKAGAAK
ncbi:MAG: electron transport complex subunit RsxC [Oscillospiraceae bacterium]